MTVADVQERLAKIRILAEACDHEAAHSEEDLLYTEILQAIADGKCTDPAAVAREAVTSDSIKFYRWCA